jgi:uncharacterized membrane protein YeaQ/YmgE (transglycosylase-associated protein family)
MSRDGARSVGAITGLVVGLLVMRSLDQGGVLAGAIFGAGGTLVGGILGERVHALFQRHQ